MKKTLLKKDNLQPKMYAKTNKKTKQFVTKTLELEPKMRPCHIDSIVNI